MAKPATVQLKRRANPMASRRRASAVALVVDEHEAPQAVAALLLG